MSYKDIVTDSRSSSNDRKKKKSEILLIPKESHFCNMTLLPVIASIRKCSVLFNFLEFTLISPFVLTSKNREEVLMLIF